jgi:hypothetical protein
MLYLAMYLYLGFSYIYTLTEVEEDFKDISSIDFVIMAIMFPLIFAILETSKKWKIK